MFKLFGVLSLHGCMYVHPELSKISPYDSAENDSDRRDRFFRWIFMDASDKKPTRAAMLARCPGQYSGDAISGLFSTTPFSEHAAESDQD